MFIKKITAKQLVKNILQTFPSPNFCDTQLGLKMAPVEDRNVRNMFLTTYWGDIFGIKSLVFSKYTVCLNVHIVLRLYSYPETTEE